MALATSLTCSPFAFLRLSACNHAQARSIKPRPVLQFATITRKRQVLRQAADTATPVATPPSARVSPTDLRKYLSGIGWQKAWIDIVLDAVEKRKFTTSVAQAEAVIDYLQEVGIPLANIENMSSIVPQLLGLDVEADIKPVIEYIQKRGVTGEGLARVLLFHPKLPLYKLSPDGFFLTNGRARASVAVVQDQHNRTAVHVNYWREGAAFDSAPISAVKPE